MHRKLDFYIWRTGAVTCENRRNKVPHSITIKIHNQTMTSHRVPVSNIHTQLGKKEKRDLGICVSNVFNLKSKEKGYVLQSLDMKFAMGANTIFIYGTYGNVHEIEELFSRLNGSSVRMIDFVLPDVMKPGFHYITERNPINGSRYNGQSLQYVDCQYRNMYLYKYLAVIDLDEFVYPMETSTNTVSLLDNISEKNNHQVAFFVFFNYQSCYHWNVFQGFQLRRWGLDATLHGELWINSKFKFKTIHRPEFVTNCRTHNCFGPINGTFGLTVSPTQAIVYHFRKKCSAGNNHSQNNFTSEIYHRHDVINDYFEGHKKHLALKGKAVLKGTAKGQWQTTGY